ncbi:SH3 domain-containing protein [Leptospira jelokensis]|uniref:SH3 domain-containing protein n=1 Tax=Leptospira jelokensis TaxID=2484931 RepID=A0A4Z1ACD6_9LEPT|nr:SH3 domain-containing protein [Leptospira jelokensis]TGL77222.1 SH3 domain-containing protein [Leptospira jelokensis]
MASKKIIFFISILFLSYNCNKDSKVPIALAYILEDKTCVYLEPTRKSECMLFLNKEDTIDVIDKSIGDKSLGQKFNWRKVIREGKIGFLPIEGEVKLFQYVTMAPVSHPYRMVVNASRLRLRSLPSLKGEILELLPNGDQVSILGLSVTRYQIDGLSEVWARIKAPSEKIGFSFLGYLKYQESADTSNEEEMVEEGDAIQGFVAFKSPDHVAYLSPGGEKGYASEDYCSKGVTEKKGANLNGSGKYFLVDRKAPSGDTNYYKINKKLHHRGDNESMDTCIYAWVSEKDVEYHNEAFASWNLENYRDKFPEKFVRFANKNNLDFERTELKKLNFTESSEKQIYHAIIYYLSSDMAPDGEEEYILEETDNSFISLIGSKYEKFNFQDLNGDGINEIIAINDFRGSYTYEYFQISNNKAIKFLTIDYNDYEVDANQCIAKLNLASGEKSMSIKVNGSDDYDKICNHFTKDKKIGIYGHKNMYQLENGKLIR